MDTKSHATPEERLGKPLKVRTKPGGGNVQMPLLSRPLSSILSVIPAFTRITAFHVDLWHVVFGQLSEWLVQSFVSAPNQYYDIGE